MKYLTIVLVTLSLLPAGRILAGDHDGGLGARRAPDWRRERGDPPRFRDHDNGITTFATTVIRDFTASTVDRPAPGEYIHPPGWIWR